MLNLSPRKDVVHLGFDFGINGFAAEIAAVDHSRQKRAALADHFHGRVELVDQLFISARGNREFRRDQADLFQAGAHDGFRRGLNDADDPEIEFRAQRFHKGGNGIARNRHDLDAASPEEPEHFYAQPRDLLSRFVSVRAVCAVAEIEDVLPREHLLNLARHRKSSDSRIDHADRAF